MSRPPTPRRPAAAPTRGDASAARARRRAAVVALALAPLAAACRREEPPVARVTASPLRLELPHGAVEEVRLRWEPRRELDSPSPVVFVHLLDVEGAVVRTVDHPFPSDWRPGRKVEDVVRLYHSAVAPALPPGSYRLTVGLYDGRSRRWPLAVETSERVGRHEYPLVTVEVPAAPRGPRLGFGEGWLEPEPAGDVQTVARRWLTTAGGVDLVDLPPQGGTLWLGLLVPEDGGDLRRVFDQGETHPVVRLSSDCSGFAATISGAGRREVAVPVAPGTAACRLLVTPNSHLVEMGSLRRLAVALERVGWSDRAAPVADEAPMAGGEGDAEPPTPTEPAAGPS